ncbi:DUF6136 family protein [Xenorhabdus doucetiae]|uniref:Uncharacterized protein n=1 Tax=Xenorhabdus doucetiae TaxID=351671 RepID=A0ABY3NQE4_9GAMM|nr:DUF6136 family protein [Xenorhabdus doucetiae]TYP04079.1 hypothetical protein LY16_02253 [Xenorhabdus doucetiae]
MKVYITLLLFRLRHYSNVTSEILKKRMGVTLFFLLIISPMAMPFLSQMRLLATPILALTDDHNIYHVLFIWSLLSISFIVICSIQTKGISGGNCQNFLETLPISKSIINSLNLSLLFIIDIPIFLPFFAAMLFCHEGGGNIVFLKKEIIILLLMMYFLFFQLIFLYSPHSCLIVFLLSLFIPFVMSITSLLTIKIFSFLVVYVFIYKIKNFQFVFFKKTKPLKIVDPNKGFKSNVGMISFYYLFGLKYINQRINLFIILIVPILILLLLNSMGLSFSVVILLAAFFHVILIFQTSALLYTMISLHMPMLGLFRSFCISEKNILSAILNVLSITMIVLTIPLVITLCYSKLTAIAIFILPITLFLFRIICILQKNRSGFIFKFLLFNISVFTIWEGSCLIHNLNI